MNVNRVAIVAGGRTPFVKSGKAFKDIGPLKLANHTVSGLIEREEIDPEIIEAIAFGTVIPEKGKPNLAREIVFETGLPENIDAQTVSSYCITGMRTMSIISDAIAVGRIEVGIAGGVDSLSLANPNTFIEPSTGLSMGEHAEISGKEWGIKREDQDKIALASHENAIAAKDKIAKEILPFSGIEHDTGPRDNSSLEALSNLKPVFEENGTITAGNSSPVTDGASSVILMSEKRAKIEGRNPLAFIRSIEYGAIDPEEGLLMAPAVALPRILERSSLKLEDISLLEIHEAFGTQVLANIKAWEQGWKGKPTGTVDLERVNVSGSSIAVGHPWSATAGRIVTTLANEMTLRDFKYGLVSICAAGAMAGTILLERD